MVGTFQGYGALYAGAGAGGAIGTKEERDVGDVGARIGLMDERLNTRVSLVLFLPSWLIWKGTNILRAIDFESSGDGKSDLDWPNAQKSSKAE
jgi:hypothetical protein